MGSFSFGFHPGVRGNFAHFKETRPGLRHYASWRIFPESVCGKSMEEANLFRSAGGGTLAGRLRLRHAVGASEIEDMRRLAPRLRTVYIPNGQQIYEDRAAVVPPAGCGRPLIGYSGRLVLEQKGLDLLIDGFASYKAAGGTGVLWLLGDGEDRSRLQRKADWMRIGSRRFPFLGTMLETKKLDTISSFDAFIHSSRWDGTPTACLEAAALGKPLIVSRETNLRQLRRKERSRPGPR